MLVCIGGLRTVAVKKPYLTHGTNRFAEIVGWQLVLTFVGAQVVSISDGDKTDSAVDAFLVAVQVGGGLLAVVGAGFEAMGFRQENAEALAAVVPVGGGVGGGDLGGGEGEQENLQELLSQALAEADALRSRAVDAEARAAAEADALRSRAVDAEAKAAAEADALRVKAAEADELKAELAKAEGELLRLKQD